MTRCHNKVLAVIVFLSTCPTQICTLNSISLKINTWIILIWSKQNQHIPHDHMKHLHHRVISAYDSTALADSFNGAKTLRLQLKWWMKWMMRCRALLTLLLSWAGDCWFHFNHRLRDSYFHTKATRLDLQDTNGQSRPWLYYCENLNKLLIHSPMT